MVRDRRRVDALKNGRRQRRWLRVVWLVVSVAAVFLWIRIAQERLRHEVPQPSRLEEGEKETDCISPSATPKVALMFLSYGKLHNEPVWRAFFEAAGRLCLRHLPPVDYTSVADPELTRPQPTSPRRRQMSVGSGGPEHDCREEGALIEEETNRLMSSTWGDRDLIKRQSLFTVYINSKGYEGTEEPSIFKDKVMVNSLDTENGYAQFTLVAATIRLIQAALAEPRNRKFLLLSESCVPIQPPEVIHAQLITEPRSRLNACRVGQRNYGRWNEKIVESRFWRKSSQFVALKRSHAALAANDQELSRHFREFCYTTWNPIRNLCVADEHYFPTLLAYHNVDNQTDCQGYLTSSEWDPSRDPWHPVSYGANTVSPELLRRLASHGKALQSCDIDTTRASTTAIYSGFTSTGCRVGRPSTPARTNSTLWMVQKGYRPLLYPCPLFARKFPADAVHKTLEAVLSCNGTGLGHWCY